jgi:hypothetical protein
MLALIRSAKYRSAAVTPTAIDGTEQAEPAPPKDSLYSTVRAQYLRLTRSIDASLEPTRRAHKYTDRVLQMLGYDEVRKAVDDGAIFEYIAKPKVQDLVRKGAAFCLDFPNEEFLIVKALESRHMPMGLAVIAAILGEVTCSRVDLVFVAYQRWREFVEIILGKFMDNAEQSTVVELLAITTQHMNLLVNSILNPLIERYQLYERKRLLRVMYRRWWVRKMFNWEVIQLMHTMIRKLRREEAMAGMFRFMS